MSLLVIKELESLILQATEERSHYYVKSVCEKSIIAILKLQAENESLKRRIWIAINALAACCLCDENKTGCIFCEVVEKIASEG